MQAIPTNRARVALVFTSRRGGQLYWARSIPAEVWPHTLKYKTTIFLDSQPKAQR